MRAAPRAVIASLSEPANDPAIQPAAAPSPARDASSVGKAGPGAVVDPGRVAIPGVVGFDHCLKRPPVLRQGVFVFHVVAVEPATWRLGLVIPKRFEASAVARNAIKRRWREAFRVRRDDWTREFGGADLVVRMTAPLVPKAEAATMTARQRARFDVGAAMNALTERLRSRRPRMASA